MKYPYVAAALATVATLAGCASAPKSPPIFSESFIANITEQGNRMFTYTATVSGGEGSGPGGGMRGRGGKGGGPGGGMGGGPSGGPGGGMGGPGAGGMSKKMRENPGKAAQDRLEEVLAETSYCPHGWFVIEKSTLQGSVEIRGECRAR